MSEARLPLFTRINRFLSGHMYVVIFTGIFLGYFVPALTALKPYVAWMFGYMTLVTALGISLSDMGNVFRAPLPLAVIFTVQHVLMPLVAFLLSGLLLPDQPLFRVGVVLSLVIPVGVVSVIWTGIAGGAVPLALTNVAIGSILSPFVVPFSVSVLFGTSIAFDTLGMMKGLALMIVFPTIVGITVHELSHGKFGRKRADVNGTISKLALMLVVAVNVAAAKSVVDTLTFSIAPVVILLAVQAAGGYLLGYATGFLPGLPVRVRKQFVFGIGMRNISAGVVIALQYFSPETAVPVVLAMVFQQPLAAVANRYLVSRIREPAPSP